MPRDNGGRRVLSDDERVLWRSFTKSIEPLREAAQPVDEDGAKTPIAKAKSAPIAPRVNLPPVEAAAKAAPPLTPLGLRKRGRVARGERAAGAAGAGHHRQGRKPQRRCERAGRAAPATAALAGAARVPRPGHR